MGRTYTNVDEPYLKERKCRGEVTNTDECGQKRTNIKVVLAQFSLPAQVVISIRYLLFGVVII